MKLAILTDVFATTIKPSSYRRDTFRRAGWRAKCCA